MRVNVSSVILGKSKKNATLYIYLCCVLYIEPVVGGKLLLLLMLSIAHILQ